MSSSQRRKRRSYSCGPCKKLKLKCNLHIPCSSCERSKRTDKCLEHPPQPPSEKELERIANRKRKKQQLARKSSITDTDISPDIDAQPQPMLPIQTNNRVDDPHIPPDNSLHILWNPNSLSTHGDALYDVYHPSETSHPPPLVHFIPVNMVPMLVIPNNTGLPPSTAFSPMDLANQLNDQVPVQMGQIKPDLANDDILYLSSQPPSHLHSEPTILELEQREDQQTMLFLLVQEISHFRSHFALPYEYFIKLFNFHHQAARDFTEGMLPIDRARTMFLDFLRDINTNTDPVYYTSIDTLRMVSLGLSMLTNGLLFADVPPGITKGHLLDGWNALLASIHAKVYKNDKLTDSVYVMQWVMIRQVYLQADRQFDALCILQHEMVSFLFKNKAFFDLVRERDQSNPYPDSQEFQIVARLWIFIRLFELEIPRFQGLHDEEAARFLLMSISPHKDINKAVFKHPYGYRDHHDLIITFASYYYKRSRETKTITDLIRSYLMLYSDAYNMLREDFRHLEVRLKASTYVENAGDFTLVVSNQLVLAYFVRWLSFIRIESNYFPSLRYASYLTSQLNLFSLALRYDDRIKAASGGKRLFYDILMKEWSLYYIRMLYHSIVFQGVFLMVLANFLPAEHLGVDTVETVIDYQWVFSAC